MPHLEVLARNSVPLAGALALVSWAVALGEAAPRLLTGPLCVSSQDAWAFAGHCPACYVAVGFTLVAVGVAMARHRSPARAAARVNAI